MNAWDIEVTIWNICSFSVSNAFDSIRNFTSEGFSFWSRYSVTSCPPEKKCVCMSTVSLPFQRASFVALVRITIVGRKSAHLLMLFLRGREIRFFKIYFYYYLCTYVCACLNTFVKVSVEEVTRPVGLELHAILRSPRRDL